MMVSSRFLRGCMTLPLGVLERTFGMNWGQLRACRVTRGVLEETSML